MDFQALANEANALFDKQCIARHIMGEEKYGPVKFLEVNTLVEASEELVDIANYARYTFIKLFILNAQIDRVQGQLPDMLGAQSFMKG
jgi:hypothetical protein